MQDDPRKKAIKLIGWGLLGEQLGIPIFETAGNLAKAVQQRQNQNIQENQILRQNLLQSALFSLQIWVDTQKQLSQKDEEISRLRRRIAELETQVATQLQPLPEVRKEAHAELSASQWLEVIPTFARCLILGAPGSGKSATGHMLLELHRWKATPYILGFPKEKGHLLPPWIGLAESFSKIPSGSIVLVDEAYLLYHARKSGFNKGVREMSEALGLARQRGYSILFVAHEARHLDKDISSYANFFVIKEPGAMDLKFERPELKEVLERAKDFFQKTAGDKRRWSYVWSPEVGFEGPLETSLPFYWTDEISRAYAGGISSPGEKPPCTSQEEKKRQAKVLREAGFSYGKVAKRLGVSKATIVNWLKHGG